MATLPLLWWLLRLTPPAPKKIPFPPLALLRHLITQQETSAHSPWWLLALRLLIASLLIIGLAQPTFDPATATTSKGPLLLVIDNDWAAARDWPARRAILHELAAQATHDKRPVYLLTTAPTGTHDDLSPLTAAIAVDQLDHLQPEAWPADWRQTNIRLHELDAANITNAVWLASGLGSNDATQLDQTLQQLAPTKVLTTTAPIYTVIQPVNDDEHLTIAVRRAVADEAEQVGLNAVSADGKTLAHWAANFAVGAPESIVTIDLPQDLRNPVAHFEVDSNRTAASVVLLDATWQHRAVGITGDAAELERHSLLSEIYYLDRALKPYADLHVGTLDDLLKTKMPVIIMTDSATIADETLPMLKDWLRHGGVLVRFAGERFSGVEHNQEKELLPVQLRGGRSLAGALSWGTPQKLQSFPTASPFSGIAVPDDIKVQRQVLAEPQGDLASKSWAMLEDGTPLVTATPIGSGLSILFHVPAQSSWSNLPLSGVFVEMLQKILQLSRNPHPAALQDLAILKPLSILDAYGEAHNPPDTVMPLQPDNLTSTAPSPQHPPGLYGDASNATAFNLGVWVGAPTTLSASIPVEHYKPRHHALDAQPYLLLAAFILLLLDFLLSLGLRGLLRLAVVLIGISLTTQPAHATTDEKMAAELTSKPYLAYVETGDATTDRTSELGLRGLAIVLQRRTSLDDIGVARINPDRDELTFYPLIYWPITETQHALSQEAAQRVTHYLRHGGMIVFDAADDEGGAATFMRRVLGGVDLPPLAPLPDQHVLQRSFYRLDHFPGRFADHDVWMEPNEASTYDGVASVIYGSNGWTAAWAVDATGHALYPCVPGGEEQREQAYRFGVNLAIYALTGTYKNGQATALQMLKKMTP